MVGRSHTVTDASFSRRVAKRGFASALQIDTGFASYQSAPLTMNRVGAHVAAAAAARLSDTLHGQALGRQGGQTRSALRS